MHGSSASKQQHSMGKLKNGSSSWLTAVKRAFRSPSKDKERSSRLREDPEPDEEEKKRAKRRWLFRKATTAQEAQAGGHAEVVKHCAAVVIQTSFRGYLARRALRALRGLVRLQALVRGRSVRKQAKLTLRCMQALARVQARARDQRRTRPSRDGGDERPRIIEDIQAMLRSRRKDAAETALSYAFSHQIWRSDRNLTEPLQEEEEGAEPPRWLDRRISSRASFDNHRSSSSIARPSTGHRDPIKTLEIDTARPFSPADANPRRPPTSSYSPATPSPRCSNSHSRTPSVAAFYNYTAHAVSRRQQAAMPNYMAATESARARVRSHSSPRRRSASPERGRSGSARKRLAFPVPDPCCGCQNPRSPSLKSAAGRYVSERRSNVSSCADSPGGETSPPSTTTDRRRWLR